MCPRRCKWASTLPIFQGPVQVTMQFSFETEAPILLTCYLISGPKLKLLRLPHSWALSSSADVSGVQNCLKSGIQLSSSFIPMFYLILGWILWILCCPSDPMWTWDLCSFELLVCGHPGLLHTACHPADGWQLSRRFSGHIDLEKALLKWLVRIFLCRTYQAFNVLAFTKVKIICWKICFSKIS